MSMTISLVKVNCSPLTLAYSLGTLDLVLLLRKLKCQGYHVTDTETFSFPVNAQNGFYNFSCIHVYTSF